MKTTREGRRFVLLAFLIAVAAVNTGNNLIYLILALMFSVAVLAVALLKVNLSGLTMDISFEDAVFAGELTYANVRIINNKRFIPSYSLRIMAEGAVSPVHCGIVRAGGTVEKPVRLLFKKRGLHGNRDFFVESSFPFILLNCRRAVGATGETLVYPGLVETDDLADRSSGASAPEMRVRSSSGDEIYSIRGYRYGDDRRRIHWKATAKMADLMVKEYAEGEYRRATIVVDNVRVEGDEGLRSVREGRKLPESGVFEKIVSIAASLARDLIERGYLVRMMSCRKVVPYGTGRDHLFRILDILALIGEEPSWESFMPGGDDFVVFVCRARETPAGLPSVPAGTIVYADSL